MGWIARERHRDGDVKTLFQRRDSNGLLCLMRLNRWAWACGISNFSETDVDNCFSPILHLLLLFAFLKLGQRISGRLDKPSVSTERWIQAIVWRRVYFRIRCIYFFASKCLQLRKASYRTIFSALVLIYPRCLLKSSDVWNIQKQNLLADEQIIHCDVFMLLNRVVP